MQDTGPSKLYDLEPLLKDFRFFKCESLSV